MTTTSLSLSTSNVMGCEGMFLRKSQMTVLWMQNLLSSSSSTMRSPTMAMVVLIVFSPSEAVMFRLFSSTTKRKWSRMGRLDLPLTILARPWMLLPISSLFTLNFILLCFCAGWLVLRSLCMYCPRMTRLGILARRFPFPFRFGCLQPSASGVVITPPPKMG